MSITNGSFESDLSGWTTTGDVVVEDAAFGVTPHDGSKQALLRTLAGGTSFSSYSTLETWLGLNAAELLGLITASQFLEYKGGVGIKQSVTFASTGTLYIASRMLTDSLLGDTPPAQPEDRGIMTLAAGDGSLYGGLQLGVRTGGSWEASATGFDYQEDAWLYQSMAITTAGTYTLGVAHVFSLAEEDPAEPVLDTATLVDHIWFDPDDAPEEREHIVTAETILIERDSERGALVLLYEDGSYAYRRISDDGGDTWSTAEAITGTGTADLLDVTHDSRKGSLILATGDGRIVESLDLGATWAERLT